MEQISAHKQFAENLRILCATRGTIADVCRSLGINRQQFNKYLSGAALPNPGTLDKLAAYFKVDQIAFFQSVDAVKGKLGIGTSTGLLDTLLTNPLAVSQIDLTLLQSLQSPLAEGCYIVHYPWLFDENQVARSAVVVFRNNGLTLFRRFTRLHSNSAFHNRNYPKGHHVGVVFLQGKNICMLGRNLVGFGELSLQVYGSEHFASENFMAGLSLVSTPWGEYCSLRSTISFFGPKKKFREALKLCAIGPVEKANLPPAIRQSVTEPLMSRIPQMRAFNLGEWLTLKEKNSQT